MTSGRRRVLVIAPAFPPHPSPAAHRARFLVRHAPDSGWDVSVLSVRPEYYSEQPDEELAAMLPPVLDITRVRAVPAAWARRVGVGDLSLRSLPFMWWALRRECRRLRPDVIFVSAPPFYSFLLAAAAHAEFGIPYVLDYTDPWIFSLPPEARRAKGRAYWTDRLAQVLEPSIVRNAAHILAVSDATHTGVRKRHPEIPSDRFSAFPIGFEASDFDFLRAHPRPNAVWDKGDGLFHVLHAGAIAPSGFETVRALLRAVAMLRKGDTRFGSRVRLHFVGTSYGGAEPLVLPHAQDLNVAEIVTEQTDRVPYTDALNLMCEAHVVLAMGSSEPHYTASKIYNCIASGRPVLAICHADTTSIHEAVRSSGAGIAVAYDDLDRAESKASETARALLQLGELGESEQRRTDLRAIAPYSAAAMTRRVTAILDDIASPADGRHVRVA